MRLSRTCQLLLMQLGIVLSATTFAVAQSPEAIAPTPARDASAIAVLEDVVLASSTASAPVIHDYDFRGTWEDAVRPGQPRSVSIRGIGSTAAYVEFMTAAGRHAVAMNGDEGTVADPRLSSEPQSMPPSVALAEPPYMFIPIIVSALADPSIGVSIVPSQPPDSLEVGVRIERRALRWQPNMAYVFVGALEIYVNRRTHLVDKIKVPERSRNNLLRVTQLYLSFEDYEVTSGWLLPHTITEKSTTGGDITIQIKSVVINSGLSTTDVTISAAQGAK